MRLNIWVCGKKVWDETNIQTFLPIIVSSPLRKQAADAACKPVPLKARVRATTNQREFFFQPNGNHKNTEFRQIGNKILLNFSFLPSQSVLPPVLRGNETHFRFWYFNFKNGKSRLWPFVKYDNLINPAYCMKDKKLKSYVVIRIPIFPKISQLDIISQIHPISTVLSEIGR